MANLYDLKKIDLNLLVIFECIYLYHALSSEPVPATPARATE